MIYKKFCVCIALWVIFFAIYIDMTFLLSISCQKDWTFKPWVSFCHVDVGLFTWLKLFLLLYFYHLFFFSQLFLTFFHISDTISSFKTRSTFLQSHKLCQIHTVNNISQVTKNAKRLLNLLQGWRVNPKKVQFKYIEYISYKSYLIAEWYAVAWGVVHKWYHHFF